MSKKAIIIISVALAVVLVTCLVLLIVLLNRDEKPSGAGGVVYDPNQGDYVPPAGVGGAQSGISIPGFGTWTIPPHVTDVTTDFYNPETNADKYYLTFEVRIPNDSEQGYEVVYKSGLVEPGKHIQKVTLSHGFEKGEYDAILFVQPYTMDDAQAPTNNANIAFKLIVK